MTLAAPMLGNRGRPGGREDQGHPPPPLQAALVCEVAICPASLLPVSPLSGLSACPLGSLRRQEKPPTWLSTLQGQPS